MDKFVDNLWDWGFLDGCFGNTRVKVTDIDGMIERRGYFLILETKLPDVEIPKGQSILFDALVSTKRFRVLIIWGERNNPLYFQDWKRFKKTKCTEKDIQRFVQGWFKWATQS